MSIRAMVEADQAPTNTFSVMLRVPGGMVEHYDVALSWKAWQAALAVLNVTVTMACEKDEAPRWVAERIDDSVRRILTAKLRYDVGASPATSLDAGNGAAHLRTVVDLLELMATRKAEHSQP